MTVAQQREQARMLEFVGRILFGLFIVLVALAGALFKVTTLETRAPEKGKSRYGARCVVEHCLLGLCRIDNGAYDILQLVGGSDSHAT
jgi:hypothetical protein